MKYLAIKLKEEELFHRGNALTSASKGRKMVLILNGAKSGRLLISWFSANQLFLMRWLAGEASPGQPRLRLTVVTSRSAISGQPGRRLSAGCLEFSWDKQISGLRGDTTAPPQCLPAATAVWITVTWLNMLASVEPQVSLSFTSSTSPSHILSPRSRWVLAGWRGTSQRSNLELSRPCELWRINMTVYVRMMSERGPRQIRCINITKDYYPSQGKEMSMRCQCSILK